MPAKYLDADFDVFETRRGDDGALYVRAQLANPGPASWTGGDGTGECMAREERTGIHKALTGMVAGLQTKEPFHHVHGGQWVADQFSSVPEPSGGLLTLVGLALLALRRRKTS